MQADAERREPWIIRTYAGFGGAEETNKRFLANLQAGQSGLSVAFDLPTQNGYDPDAGMAQGEVGGCGVGISHLGDIERLFQSIDPGVVNTSMTINATAPFLLSLYLVMAEKRGIPWAGLRGTVQNDLMKEFVARGTSIFTPAVSLRLTTDLITFASEHVPQWNPINVCGYHYMESGARPHEEIGYTFANALMVLDDVKPRLSSTQFEKVIRRISFFINSGIELVPEICKMRAYAKLWTELCKQEFGIAGVPFRAGCQVRSVSLPAEQPENNIVRIALQALPAILSSSARVNALQLPGFREALGLPDRMEQTLSIRTQQILMFETKIADYPDIFDGNPVIAELTGKMIDEARSLALTLRTSGYDAAIGIIDRRLTEAMMKRQNRLDRQEDIVVGVNRFRDPVGLSEQLSPTPPTAQDPSFGEKRIMEMKEWRASRNHDRWQGTGEDLRECATAGENIMPATIEFVRAGGTIGEWSTIIEEATSGRYSMTLSLQGRNNGEHYGAIPKNRPVRIVLGKTGLDGHNNALKVLALSCRDAGMEVVYAGTKIPPLALVRAAIEEDADVLAISCLSGSHLHVAEEILTLKKELGVSDLKFILGGTIPEHDRDKLTAMGVDLVVSDPSLSLAEIIRQIRDLIS